MRADCRKDRKFIYTFQNRKIKYIETRKNFTCQFKTNLNYTFNSDLRSFSTGPTTAEILY
jgi:hypothetical protein